MDGAELIATERQRQVSEEGWTPEHDDGHMRGELALAGACYAVPFPDALAAGWSWPFEPEVFKRVSNGGAVEPRIRELVKAGALIAAEIDRLERVKANDA
jgi:hypothetical protein